jgi:hypothetical protein
VPPPSQRRLALTHPLFSRQLLPSLLRGQQRREEGTGAGSSAQPSKEAHQLQEQVVSQPAGDSNDAPLHLQLRQVQCERDAAEEMLQQMVQQTQALLRDKQQLQLAAATLAAQKQQLEERLDNLLVDQEEWEEDAEDGEIEQGGEAAAVLAACGDGSSGGGTMQPPTPSAEAAECVMEALQGRLHALSDERQRLLLLLDLHTQQGQATGGSNDGSSNSSSGGSSPTAGPAAPTHSLEY